MRKELQFGTQLVFFVSIFCRLSSLKSGETGVEMLHRVFIFLKVEEQSLLFCCCCSDIYFYFESLKLEFNLVTVKNVTSIVHFRQ